MKSKQTAEKVNKQLTDLVGGGGAVRGGVAGAVVAPAAPGVVALDPVPWELLVVDATRL